jgi:hypothetical protein
MHETADGISSASLDWESKRAGIDLDWQASDLGIQDLGGGRFGASPPAAPDQRTCQGETHCPDCGVSPGTNHSDGCDIEQCPYCGYQLISCPCECEPSIGDRLPWTGTWPGAAECQEYGWFKDKTEDLNRLRSEAVWDQSLKRFIRLESGL